MPGGDILRRLRGALGNGLVWGFGWFGAALSTFGLLRLVGLLPADFSWGVVLETATNSGIIGAVAGGAFAGFIGLRYGGRRLLDISWTRFGMGGAAVAGLFVPAFIVLGRLVTGVGWLPIETLMFTGVWAAILGGATAGGSIKLAQQAAKELSTADRDQLQRSDEADLIMDARPGAPS